MHRLLSLDGAGAALQTPESATVRLPAALEGSSSRAAAEGDGKSSSGSSAREIVVADIEGRVCHLRLPVICKPLQSCSSAESHQMTVITRRCGFYCLCRSLKALAPQEPFEGLVSRQLPVAALHQSRWRDL
jgi:hypothetical protein